MATLDPTARITVDELKEIFETAMSDAQLAAFVNTATLVVTEELTGQGLSAGRLKQIELYLSAHYAHTNDPRFQTENTAGEHSYTAQGKTDMGLNATFYGQQVLMLDTTGKLAKAAAGLKRASFTVLSEYDE